jgi:hypothetical protein
LLGDGRVESLRRASNAKFVVARSGRGEGSLEEVGRRADGLKDGEDSLSDAMVCARFKFLCVGGCWWLRVACCVLRVALVLQLAARQKLPKELFT